MPTMWVIKRGDKISPAMSTERLVKIAKFGKIQADDLIGVEGENQWRRADSLGRLFDGQAIKTANPQAETKACPMCGETILAAANKCKHCGEYLNDIPITNDDSSLNCVLNELSTEEKTAAAVDDDVSPIDLIQKQTKNTNQQKTTNNIDKQFARKVTHTPAQQTMRVPKYAVNKSKNNQLLWVIIGIMIFSLTTVVIYLSKNNVDINAVFSTRDMDKTFEIKIDSVCYYITNVSDELIVINCITIDNRVVTPQHKEADELHSKYPIKLTATSTLIIWTVFGCSYIDIYTNIGNFRYRPSFGGSKRWEIRSNIFPENLKADIQSKYKMNEIELKRINKVNEEIEKRIH